MEETLEQSGHSIKSAIEYIINVIISTVKTCIHIFMQSQ